MLKQIQSFLDTHSLLEPFQSGFKALHSTELALLKVFHDLLLTTDTGDCAILILLDLTAAFDTVDHNILISRLEHWVDIKGTALEWFISYLADKSLKNKSWRTYLLLSTPPHGVPQGSILGPILFSLYLLPLGYILRKHNICFHCYADDTKIYMPLKFKDPHSVQQLLDCLDDIKSWMSINFLNSNEIEHIYHRLRLPRTLF